MLLVQVSLPVLLFAGGESVLEIKGGTNAEMAPQLDYTLRVFKPIAERMGVHFECEIIRRGYFPQGGGHLKLTIRPIAGLLVPIQLTEPGQVESIGGYSFVAGNLPGTVLHRMTDEAIKALRAAFPRVHVDITRVKENENMAIGSGVGIILTARTSTQCILAASELGKRGVPAEEVGRKTAEALSSETNNGLNCVDSHLQDQLIIFMALASGDSVIKTGPITLHTETAIHICQLLTGQANFSIFLDQPSQTSLIKCTGIALLNLTM